MVARDSDVDNPLGVIHKKDLLDSLLDNGEFNVERLVQSNGALLIRGLRFVGSQQFGSVARPKLETTAEVAALLAAMQELRRDFDEASARLYDRVGVPLLEDMIGDERWFVVRNMVGILGEIRSADAVEHFRRTIAHSDARVRRETILALSKLGGEEAVPLLAQGLNDAEANLRGTAALGLGLTKAGTAVMPLLTRLARSVEPTMSVNSTVANSSNMEPFSILTPWWGEPRVMRLSTEWGPKSRT